MAPRKRPVDGDAASALQKKPRTQQPTPGPSKQPTPVITIFDEPDDAFVVGVKLPPKFDIFPEKLRKRLISDCRNSLRKQAINIESNIVAEMGKPHTIVEAQGCKGSCNAFKTISGKEKSADVGFANKELLVLALDKFNKILIPDNFVELDPPKDKELISNPSFVHWHSVRHGEIGWGFDRHGCLSLYSTKFVDSTVREYVLYVKRAEFVVKHEP